MHGLEVTLGWSDIGLAAIAAAALSFLLCLALVATRRWHGRFTNDGTRGVQKFHLAPTPRIGGLALALAYVLVWPVLPAELRAPWALIGLAGALPLLAGLGEDLTGTVGVRYRLLATMAGGVLFALLTGYTMHKVYLPGVDWLLSFQICALLFTGFAMGGVANAVNIIDGFNGLASGSLLIMLAAFAWVGHRVGDDLVFALAVLYGALILGFFLVNFPFGKIFLGDGGAYFAGFLLASLGVLLPMRNPETSAWTAILICAYPVIETLASMHRKAMREGHSVGQPDRVHWHMLAYRRYARRLVPGRGAVHLRNPATSLVTWPLPLLTGVFAALAYSSVLASALLFFLTVFIYVQVYKVMSLNHPNLPVGLARLL
ncbi:glycosyltransferase [Amaricoccus sp.]|uniref:MraY family glycosyltransferase n=1 Tax=Amaricoccus sp. TaxID=1872485 RepID=UPI00260971E7|nr:glycosyltransferase [Amaricoccus sp.]HRO12095.1 glycosyltransferase [Amaricoccus sp.]